MQKVCHQLTNNIYCYIFNEEMLHFYLITVCVPNHYNYMQIIWIFSSDEYDKNIFLTYSLVFVNFWCVHQIYYRCNFFK